MTQLVHKPCGAEVYLDLSTKIKMITPSYSFRANGEFVIGAVEIVELKGPSAKARFICSKCKAEMDAESPELVSKCNVCRNDHPVSSMMLSMEITQICQECVDAFGRPPSPKDSSRLREYKQMVGSLSGIRFRRMIDIVKNPIRL